ncbi:MAG: thymidylate synthase [Armatimonadota bacterium]
MSSSSVWIVPGNPPLIAVEGQNLPEAWEKAVLATWEHGTSIPTQYDREGDPPSRDATVTIVVRDPFAEPRIHRAFPGGLDDLEAYRLEVVEGIHNHWIDPEGGKWTYTYNERLFAYALPNGTVVNQVEKALDELTAAPHTRRAQMITWQPWKDPGTIDPPCMQRIWLRIFGDRLAMSVDMRSNDAFKAAFMNMYAFTDLQRCISEKLSERLKRRILPGQYVHRADSFHIYGSYFKEFEGFLESLGKRSFGSRTYRTEEVSDILEDARREIMRSLEEERRTGLKGVRRS